MGNRDSAVLLLNKEHSWNHSNQKCTVSIKNSLYRIIGSERTEKKEVGNTNQLRSTIIIDYLISPITVVGHSFQCNFPKNTKHTRLPHATVVRTRSLAAGRLCAASSGARLPPQDADNCYCPLCPVIPPPSPPAAHIHTLQQPHADPTDHFNTFPNPKTVLLLTYQAEKNETWWTFIKHENFTLRS